MAAIISQMAANKRARQKTGHQHIISSDKCVYTLPPFDPCFNPLVHNKYMRALAQRQRLDETKGTVRRAAAGPGCAGQANGPAAKPAPAAAAAAAADYPDGRGCSLAISADLDADEYYEKRLRSSAAVLTFGMLAILVLALYVWILLWNAHSA